jgi:hypothetical protein
MKNILILGFLAVSLPSFSQCGILNRLFPDGTMMYYMEPVVFYWTKAKELKGCLVTDKENYFLGLRPIPFPVKPLGNKLKADIELKLSNDTVYRLSHYDTRYLENDTIMELLYLIDKRDLEDILNFEATEVKIDMKGEEGLRTYVFKLHKKALQEQLACFLKAEEDKKKK